VGVIVKKYAEVTPDDRITAMIREAMKIFVETPRPESLSNVFVFSELVMALNPLNFTYNLYQPTFF